VVSPIRAMQPPESFEAERFVFRSDVAPVPCARARVVRQGGKSHGVTPKRTADFKRAVSLAAAAERPDGWDLDGWFRVELIVRRSRRAGDGDNFYKGIVDAIRGIAWHDDAQVLSLEVVMRDGMSPGFSVEIFRFKGRG
jgi:Holliday junction resolvase RusA-like endonuclease